MNIQESINQKKRIQALLIAFSRNSMKLSTFENELAEQKARIVAITQDAIVDGVINGSNQQVREAQAYRLTSELVHHQHAIEREMNILRAERERIEKALEVEKLYMRVNEVLAQFLEMNISPL